MTTQKEHVAPHPAYTIQDLMAYNEKSRAWILRCIEIGRLPQPDARAGKNGQYSIWYALHKIADVKK
jgi:hypothetical protein